MKKMISMIVVMLFFTISVSSEAINETEKEIVSNEEIHIAAFGSSLLIGISRVGFVMTNTGDDTFSDVSWSFSVTRTEDDEIVFTHSDVSEEFTPDLSTIFSVHLPFDVGYLRLTATASCTELESDISDTITVFQLGPIFIGRSFLFSMSL